MDRWYQIKSDVVILLVIAHPDDEVMFFGPLLLKYRNTSDRIHILCLSNGNDEGKGNIREKELYDSANVFKIPRERVYVITHDLLQDGMNTIWPVNVMADIIETYIHRIQPNIIVTFDQRGISNHPNHIATYRGVQQSLSNVKPLFKDSIIGLSLETVPIIRKFTGIFDFFLSYMFHDRIILSFGLVYIIQAMIAHKSQFVWYRRLFIFFSRYSYINTFKKIT